MALVKASLFAALNFQSGLVMNIEIVEKADHLKLIEIWEASVRATHDFLAEDDLQKLKP